MPRRPGDRDGPARPRALRRPDGRLRRGDPGRRRDRRRGGRRADRPAGDPPGGPFVLAGLGFGGDRRRVDGPHARADRCAGLVLVDGGWEDVAVATGATPEEWLARDRGATGGARARWAPGSPTARPSIRRPGTPTRSGRRGRRSSRLPAGRVELAVHAPRPGRLGAGDARRTTRRRCCRGWRRRSSALVARRRGRVAGRRPARRGAAPPGRRRIVDLCRVVPGRRAQPDAIPSRAPSPRPCSRSPPGLPCGHEPASRCPSTSAPSSTRSRPRSARSRAPIPTRSSRRRPSRAAPGAAPARRTGGSRRPSARSCARSARTRTARAWSGRRRASTGCTRS